MSEGLSKVSTFMTDMFPYKEGLLVDKSDRLVFDNGSGDTGLTALTSTVAVPSGDGGFNSDSQYSRKDCVYSFSDNEGPHDRD